MSNAHDTRLSLLQGDALVTTRLMWGPGATPMPAGTRLTVVRRMTNGWVKVQADGPAFDVRNSPLYIRKVA